MGRRVRVPVRGRYVSGDNERIRRKSGVSAMQNQHTHDSDVAVQVQQEESKCGWSKVEGVCGWKGEEGVKRH